MTTSHKPTGYNAVSPYFIVDGAQKLIDLLKQIFDVEELRRYERPDGTIMHAEVKIDYSVLMMSDSTDQFPPNHLMMHVYVKDVDFAFKKAIDAGCDSIQEPKETEGDPDRRGTFSDFAGNVWSIGSQKTIA